MVAPYRAQIERPLSPQNPRWIRRRPAVLGSAAEVVVAHRIAGGSHSRGSFGRGLALLSLTAPLVFCALPLLGISQIGCGGEAASEGDGTRTALDEFRVENTAKPVIPVPDKKSTEDFSPEQQEQFKVALRRGGEKAANCAKVVEDGPRGAGSVKVVFDGKVGRVTDVHVDPPYAGTGLEQCIKNAFLHEYSVPFEGKLEVPFDIKLPPRADEPADAKKPKGKGAAPAPAGKDPKKKP